MNLVSQQKRYLLRSINVDLILAEEDNKRCLEFMFKGKFTRDSSASVTQAWIEECQANQGVKYVHLWDCSQMNAFDFGAQEDWMKTLVQYSNQIEFVIIISESLLIRGAARVMSKFSKLDLRVYDSRDQYLKCA